MKKIIILLIVLTWLTATNAQLTSEALDILSTQVSDIEKMTEGLKYWDGNGKEYQLNFPAEPFTVWSHDKLASKAVFKTQDGKKVLHLTENIDLTKATGISVSDNYYDVANIRVDFPKGVLTTQLIETGVVVGTVNPDYLEFFCPSKKLNDKKEFLFDVQFTLQYAIISALKIDKKLLTEKAFEQEFRDWRADDSGFASKYPKSLFLAQVAKAKSDAEKLKPQLTYVNAMIEKYGLKEGLSPEEYVAFNPNTASLFKKRGKELNGIVTYANTKGSGNPYPLGPYVANVSVRRNVVYSYSDNIISGKTELVSEQIRLFLQEVYDTIEQKYRTYDGFYTILDLPGAPLKLRFYWMAYDKWQALNISF